ncbi:hypothetical protein K8Q94_00545 [Candidatus Nomurabacteria bacterium]|nr:hypothetical protein [Candidatus Nomurabacteria bacterium]
MKKTKIVIDEERKLRNITDYVFDCTSRLYEHADLLLYLGKHKDDFVEPVSKNSMSIIVSIFDVYSRDAIIMLNILIDKDDRTSSLTTLVNHVTDPKKHKRYLARLKKLKAELNGLVQARANQVAHFNTHNNIHENGFMQVNQIIQLDPRYLKRITKKIENLMFDLKEELSIDGAFIFHKGERLAHSFARLIGKPIKLKP